MLAKGFPGNAMGNIFIRRRKPVIEFRLHGVGQRRFLAFKAVAKLADQVEPLLNRQAGNIDCRHGAASIGG